VKNFSVRSSKLHQFNIWLLEGKEETGRQQHCLAAAQGHTAVLKRKLMNEATNLCNP